MKSSECTFIEEAWERGRLEGGFRESNMDEAGLVRLIAKPSQQRFMPEARLQAYSGN